MNLDSPTEALVRFASAIATGREALGRERAAAYLASGGPRLWADELILQSILMVGYPRALTGAQVWRAVAAAAADSLEDGADFSQVPAWLARGAEVCRAVYGGGYDKLRANVRALHPAMDAWMVTEGYGRTLGRAGLDLLRREYCVIAQVSVLGAERQLHSHLRGALNIGASVPSLDRVLALALPDTGPAETAAAEALWGRIRP
ncbi:MAG: carboxymuconolactone decarboxylase family protein [Gemmatimonadota bacterium]